MLSSMRGGHDLAGFEAAPCNKLCRMLRTLQMLSMLQLHALAVSSSEGRRQTGLQQRRYKAHAWQSTLHRQQQGSSHMHW